MEHYNRIEEFKRPDVPLVMTIGNFDGIHPGHQRVIHQTVSQARSIHGRSVVLTFSNHPSEILPGKSPVLPICTPLHKIALLEQLEVDYLIQIPFTLEFSQQTAEEFILSLRKSVPFKHLILGYDARFGKNRSGDRETIKQLSSSEGFSTEYLEKVEIHGRTVSSSNIRLAIIDGNFNEVENLLGRPYSILSTVIKGKQIGRKLGYPTANIDVANLCLPPLGVYAVYLKFDQKMFPGVANLGIAPTLKNSQSPTFEVFLFDHVSDLHGKSVELFPLKFLRNEVHFPSVNALQEQIRSDINQANLYFKSR